MKPNCYLLLLCLSTLLCFSSCSKKEPEPPEPPQLTPMTTTGAETLSFLKDGEVWIADKDATSPIAIIRLASKQLVVETWQKLGINQKERFGFSFVVDDYEPRRYYGGNSPLRSLGGGFARI